MLIRERIMVSEVVPIDLIKEVKSKKRAATILVVEDDDAVRKALQRILVNDGHNVLAASDGSELTQVLEESMVDLILLDIGLPWIDGYELAEIMKAQEELRSIPIVFISGQSDISAIKKGFSVGAHDYIKKPFDIDNVRKTVSTLLELSR